VHDNAIALPERMQLAEKRPLRRRPDAAMGQQDCGQCGYSCEDYANAIALNNEERSTSAFRAAGNHPHGEGALCGAWRRTRGGESAGECGRAGCGDYDRRAARAVARQAAEIAFISRRALNKKGSNNRKPWHIDLDLTETGIAYTVGDALGVFPHNDTALVDAVIKSAQRAARFPDRRADLRAC